MNIYIQKLKAESLVELREALGNAFAKNADVTLSPSASGALFYAMSTGKPIDAVESAAAPQPAQVEHRAGCDALGGYGHGVGPCSCGAQPAQAVLSDDLSAALNALLNHVIDDFRGMNPSNYTHDDACDLNNWGVEASGLAQAVQDILAASQQPAAAPVQVRDSELLEDMLSFTQLVAAWASSSRYENDMIDKVREIQPRIKAVMKVSP